MTDLPAVLRQVQSLNEMVSVKYRVQKVIGLEELKSPVGREKLLLVVQADVLAGVDLSALRVESLEVKGGGSQQQQRQIAVALPAARILHVVPDEKQTKVWDRQVTWWTPWVPYNLDLERQARLAAIESIRESATEMGILIDARRNAEQNIRRLLEALGFQAVTFPT